MLDLLPYYVAIKKQHKSGAILNLTQLSHTIGCSYNALSRRLNQMQARGYINYSYSKGKPNRADKKHLHFVASSKLTWERGTKCVVSNSKVGKPEVGNHVLKKVISIVKRKKYLVFDGSTLKELKIQIGSFNLSNNIFRQEKGFEIGHSHKVSKKTNSIKSKMHIGISAETLGKKHHRSKSTGQRIIDRAKRNGFITTKHKFITYGIMTHSEYLFAKRNSVIPYHSRAEKVGDRYMVYSQTYSEMSTKCADGIDRINKVSDKSASNATKKSFSPDDDQLPFYATAPKGYFNTNFLKKVGYTKTQIDKIFTREAIACFQPTGSVFTKNQYLMSFKLFNDVVASKTEWFDIYVNYKNGKNSETSNKCNTKTNADNDNRKSGGMWCDARNLILGFTL